MELEALGGITGEVLDIGCGLGDNAIYLASRGHSVTGLDGSPAAIEKARQRAADAGVSVTFDVADATKLTGYDGRFDTVVDSALYHCLDDEGRQAYAASLYRATRPGARWHLYCFSEGNVNGLIAPMGSVPESNIRDTLTANGWRIDFLGPTTYLGNSAGFRSGEEGFPQAMAEQLPPEALGADADGHRPVPHHRGPARRRPGVPAVHSRARAPGGLTADLTAPQLPR